MISVILTVGVLAGSVVSISKTVPIVDSWNVTHYELELHISDANNQFADLNRKIDENAEYEKCTGLRGEIRMAETALFEAEQHVNGDGHLHSSYVNKLRLDLEELRTVYSVLECARILS